MRVIQRLEAPVRRPHGARTAPASFSVIDAIFPDDPFPPPYPLPPAPGVSVTVAPRTPVCGDGFREGAEGCDDGNTDDGDCCSSTCTLDPAGTPCPDADVCTSDETCDGAGACVAGSTLECDNGLPCTHDVCDPTSGCQSLAEPDPSCSQHIVNGTLRVIDRPGNDTADRIKINAKFAAGTIGDPTATTEYAVCVFDAAAGVTSNAPQIDVPPGSPWAARGGSGSFGYVDPSRANDGVEKIRLKQNKNGIGKFLLIGKGLGLPLPGPAGVEEVDVPPVREMGCEAAVGKDAFACGHTEDRRPRLGPRGGCLQVADDARIARENEEPGRAPGEDDPPVADPRCVVRQGRQGREQQITTTIDGFTACTYLRT